MPDANKESLKYLLHATMTAKFLRAKQAWTWVLCTSVGIIGLSVTSVLMSSPSAYAAIDFVSVVLGIALFSLRLRAQALYGEAEELRRAHRQLESHGIRPRDNVVLSLPASADTLNLGVVAPDREYYGTKAPPGPHRLADNLVESASYTRDLAHRTWQICAAVAVGSLILVLGLLWYGTVMGTGGTGLMRLVPHLFSLLVFGIVADLGVSFGRLSRVATDTVGRLESVRDNPNLRIEDLIPAVTDYDCALASTGAPIPDRVYSGMQDELNKRWARYLETRASRSEPTLVEMPSTLPGVPVTKPRAALRDLLFTLFDDEELRRFVVDLADPDLSACLPGPAASFAAVVDGLVGVLARRKLADSDFFAALEQVRPRFVPRIREVAQLWAR